MAEALCICARMDSPCLFDLEKDPDELINFYANAEYASAVQEIQQAMVTQMEDAAELPAQMIYKY
jgi:uncharacterized sulfatase